MALKKRIIRNRLLAGIGFFAFTSVVFINNLNQLISTYLKVDTATVNLIAWIGLIGSCIFAIYKASEGELL